MRVGIAYPSWLKSAVPSLLTTFRVRFAGMLRACDILVPPQCQPQRPATASYRPFKTIRGVSRVTEKAWRTLRGSRVHHLFGALLGYCFGVCNSRHAPVRYSPWHVCLKPCRAKSQVRKAASPAHRITAREVTCTGASSSSPVASLVGCPVFSARKLSRYPEGSMSVFSC